MQLYHVSSIQDKSMISSPGFGCCAGRVDDPPVSLQRLGPRLRTAAGVPCGKFLRTAFREGAGGPVFRSFARLDTRRSANGQAVGWLVRSPPMPRHGARHARRLRRRTVPTPGRVGWAPRGAEATMGGRAATEPPWPEGHMACGTAALLRAAGSGTAGRTASSSEEHHSSSRMRWASLSPT